MIYSKNLSKTYYSTSDKTIALNKVNFSTDQGDFIAIMGKSGSGKSTLLNAISGLDHDYEGDIYINKRKLIDHTADELSELRKDKIGFVFQEFHLFESLTVFENIALPYTLNDPTPREVSIRVNKLIQRLDIHLLKDRYPNELSRGQQQRVAIARALVNEPQYIFADEPTGNLDVESTNTVLDLLNDINKEMNVTIILVTHDEQCTKYCNKLFIMNNGRLEVSNV